MVRANIQNFDYTQNSKRALSPLTNSSNPPLTPHFYPSTLIPFATSQKTVRNEGQIRKMKKKRKMIQKMLQ